MNALFIGLYPAGIVYADRRQEVRGDYKRCAFLSYATLELAIDKDCSADLRAAIKADAAKYKPGDTLQVSQCGQTITLGGKN